MRRQKKEGTGANPLNSKESHTAIASAVHHQRLEVILLQKGARACLTALLMQSVELIIQWME